MQSVMGVPRPRAHLTRYSGVLAPAFARRAEIVPAVEESATSAGRPSPPEGAEPPRAPGRFPWASLLWRVFLTDALACGECGGRMRIVAVVTSRAGLARILGHAGLPAEPPRFHPARPPPQAELPFGDCGNFDAHPDYVAFEDQSADGRR